MTGLVEKMPGGYLMGILFFVSLLMAGLSSNICHFMICSLPLVDAGKDRKKSILGVFVLLLIWGLPSAWNSTFLSNQDWVAGQMMIVGVMFSCYAMIKFGVSKIRGTYLNNPYTGMKIGKWWEVSIRSSRRSSRASCSSGGRPSASAGKPTGGTRSASTTSAPSCSRVV